MATTMTKPMFGIGIVTLFIKDREVLKNLVERELDKIPKCQAGAHNNRQYLIIFLQKLEVWAMCNFTKLANMDPYSIYMRESEPTTRPAIDLANDKPWSSKSISLAQEIAKYGNSNGPGTESAHAFCNLLSVSLERRPQPPGTCWQGDPTWQRPRCDSEVEKLLL